MNKDSFPDQLFVDADALVALADQKDIHHARSMQIQQRIDRQHIRLFTSQFAVGEAITVISQKGGLHLASISGATILSGNITIQHTTHHHMEQALKRLAKQTSKNSRFTELTRSSHRRIFEVRHR